MWNEKCIFRDGNTITILKQQWFNDDTGEWIALTDDDIEMLKNKYNKG